MKLKTLCNLAGGRYEGEEDPEIRAVSEDSRRVTPGALFVAVPGGQRDGHEFARQAIANGAAAIMGDRVDGPLSQEEAGLWNGVPYVATPHPRYASGIMAHALAGDPSRKLTVIGVTGTNGKTSTAVLIQHMLTACGEKAANFGTLGYAMGDASFNAAHTTPFPEDLARLFREAVDRGMTHVVMEVSSHALEQERVAGIDFDVAAFTNLSQDHLDFHGDMDHYFRAKRKLFERLTGDGKFGVVNTDDAWANAMLEACRVPCFTYGAKGMYRAKHVKPSLRHTSFTAVGPRGETPIHMALLGRHNVANALCAFTVCAELGLPKDVAAASLETLSSVPGRFERVDAGQDFQVVVDYAHTEDGLKNVLQAARPICKGRLITVFGCGGDRDRGKRPKMGAVAARLSDLAIVTSDNPRTENPDRILLDIEVGMQQTGKRLETDYLRIPDRKAAIQEAIGLAKSGDLVLIAGKGHEDYQIVGEERRHFDDREVARQALEARGKI